MKTLTLPWSKSITNRDLILASLCEWKCEIKWYLQSDDTKHMIEALKQLWINIIENIWELIIDWWVEKINWNNQALFVNQSWTCMRFLTWLAVLNKKWTISITWEERLLERPMWDLFDWIKQLWLKLETNSNYPPVKIFPSKIKNNIIEMNWTSSSQFFTALMQIWAFIPWWLEIKVIWDMVSKPYIDLTIEELRKFGIKVENKLQKYQNLFIPNQKIVNPWILQVEWDASALSYFANYAIFKNEEIKIKNIWENSKQWDYKYLKVLKKYFDFEYSSTQEATILRWKLNKIIKDEKYREIDFEDMPDVSLSFMSLAPLLPWKTKIIWLQTLNLKECKRIDAMGDELQKLWVKVEYDDKSITIFEWFNPLKKVDIETYNDHRIAMVFWILKIFLEKKYDTEINILNPNCVSKTYPDFWKELELIENK